MAEDCPMNSTVQDQAGIYDLLVIGGGATGCCLARDAAGRGLSVFLCERGDLGGGTSSASTGILHGGLLQPERRRIRPVRDALAERDSLLAIAPHLVSPARFVLPHDPGLRSARWLRLGLFLHDRLGDVRLGGRSRLPVATAVDLRSHRYGRPLRPDFPRGFVYSDCVVDDARLVLAHAMDAAARGARIATRTAVVALRREADHWVAVLRRHGAEWQVRARLLANAAGAWAEQVRQAALGAPVPITHRRGSGLPPAAGMRLVRGSHIVVPRLFEGSQAYVFQTEDRRLVYALPHHGAFTRIGATEVPHDDPATLPQATAEEVAWLCRAANRYLKRSIGPEDVVATSAGIRALPGDEAAGSEALAARQHRIHLDGAGRDGMQAGGAAPLLTLSGGSLTTCRAAAERAMDLVAPLFPGLGRAWTARTPLPGGDLPGGDADAFLAELILRHPGLDRRFLHSLARRHGSLTDELLGGAKRPADLGRDFGGGLTECEIDWLYRREWAETADDILWRRTRAGLFMSVEGRDLFADWFERQIAA